MNVLDNTAVAYFAEFEGDGVTWLLRPNTPAADMFRRLNGVGNLREGIDIEQYNPGG